MHYTFNKQYFNVWSDNMAYLLGFIAADGHIELNKYGTPSRLTISLVLKI